MTKTPGTTKKKKINDLDRYIVFSIACIILYTIAEHILIIVTGQTLDLLTTLFFGFFAGEVTICALIKKLKLKQEKKQMEENKEEGINGSFG